MPNDGEIEILAEFCVSVGHPCKVAMAECEGEEWLCFPPQGIVVTKTLVRSSDHEPVANKAHEGVAVDASFNIFATAPGDYKVPFELHDASAPAGAKVKDRAIIAFNIN